MNYTHENTGVTTESAAKRAPQLLEEVRRRLRRKHYSIRERSVSQCNTHLRSPIRNIRSGGRSERRRNRNDAVGFLGMPR